ncbi:alpha/beta-hydrolase [Hyaloscypha variabilis]
MDLSKFAAFDIHSTHYKVDGIQIPVHILIPPLLPVHHSRPTIVYFHGGGLVRGAALFTPHFAHWILTYALLHFAIIIAPEHRLLPESTSHDILSDISDFWIWFHTSLPTLSILSSKSIKTPSHPLVIGESAGAYLSLQSALSQPKNTISAIIMQNPMLDLSAPWYTKEYPKTFNWTFKPIVSAAPLFRSDIMLSMFQQGRFPEFLGTDSILYPLERIEDGEVDAHLLPKVDTRRFERVVRARGRGEKLFIHYEEGADHGFEYRPEVTLITPWLDEGMRRVSGAWLG